MTAKCVDTSRSGSSSRRHGNGVWTVEAEVVQQHQSHVRRGVWLAVAYTTTDAVQVAAPTGSRLQRSQQLGGAGSVVSRRAAISFARRLENSCVVLTSRVESCRVVVVPGYAAMPPSKVPAGIATRPRFRIQ